MPRDLIRTWQKDGYKLEIFDRYRTDGSGKAVVAYRLTHRGEVIFPEGPDFHCSPLHSTDGDGTVTSILSFCSLRPGDTDHEFFESYSTRQLDWCCEHGEELALLAAELEQALRTGRRP